MADLRRDGVSERVDDIRVEHGVPDRRLCEDLQPLSASILVIGGWLATPEGLEPSACGLEVREPQITVLFPLRPKAP